VGKEIVRGQGAVSIAKNVRGTAVVRELFRRNGSGNVRLYVTICVVPDMYNMS